MKNLIYYIGWCSFIILTALIAKEWFKIDIDFSVGFLGGLFAHKWFISEM